MKKNLYQEIKNSYKLLSRNDIRTRYIESVLICHLLELLIEDIEQDNTNLTSDQLQEVYKMVKVMATTKFLDCQLERKMEIIYNTFEIIIMHYIDMGEGNIVHNNNI